jgi:YggT family protein
MSMIEAFLWLFNTLVQLIIIVLIVNAVLSWLVAFDIISRRNQVVGQIWNFTDAVTRPMLAPIRRFVPPVANVDLAPLLLILGLSFLQVLANNLARGVL